LIGWFSLIAPDAIRPVCIEGCASPLKFFMSKAGIKNNEPSQLTEYTLGSDNVTELNVHQVDYDVSYVDTAYLPGAMEPYNNRQVGYIGSPQSVAAFRQALTSFLQDSNWKGWPQFKNNQGAIVPKVPSALHIFAGDSDMHPSQGDPAKTSKWPYPPIQALADRWTGCVSKTSEDAICAGIIAVNELIAANYANYVKNYRSLGCDYAKHPEPVAPLTRPGGTGQRRPCLGRGALEEVRVEGERRVGVVCQGVRHVRPPGAGGRTAGRSRGCRGTA